MRSSWLFVLLCVLGGFGLHAEWQPSSEFDHSNQLSIGTDVGSIAGNLISGIRVATPSFFHDYMRVSATAHLGWAQNVMSINDTTNSWIPYGLYKLGLHVGGFIFALPIRISSTAELALVTPSIRISSKSVIVGLAGSMDLELFTDPRRIHAVFVNLGGIGLFSPMANGLKGKPSFANGFMNSFGYRFYF